MFSIERGFFLFLIPIAFFALLFFLFRFFAFKKAVKNTFFIPTRFSFSVVSRIFCRFLAFLCAILAASGISFGKENVLVKKNGSSLCIVFDISYSMNAEDSFGKISRLEAEKRYVRALLPFLSGIQVSAVIAKGGGFVAVPLTEDFASIESLLDTLSPNLLTAKGSSLGKGIDSAAESLRNANGKSSAIWVFTDGDETDGALENSLFRAAERVESITFVGFGSKKGAEIQAGGGETVHTSLRENEILQIAQKINNSLSVRFGKRESVRFILAEERSSAHKLLDSLPKSAETVSSEMRKVPRHSLFILLTLIFLVLSFVFSEFNFARFSKNSKKTMIFSLVFLIFGCSAEKAKILEGTWAYRNGDFNSATAAFFSLLDSEDETAQNYALFGLSATYCAIDELDVAQKRFYEIDFGDDKKLESCVFYNLGVIDARKGNFSSAAENFKKAILANPENIDARVNLEFCAENERNSKARAGESILKSVSESISNEAEMKERAIFNLIRESEQNRYRNSAESAEENGALDY